MPLAAERALKAEAVKKFGSTTSPRARAYIWGAPVMQAARNKKKKAPWRNTRSGGMVYQGD